MASGAVNPEMIPVTLVSPGDVVYTCDANGNKIDRVGLIEEVGIKDGDVTLYLYFGGFHRFPMDAKVIVTNQDHVV